MRRLVTLLSIFCLFLVGYPTVINAQSGILNPADPIVTYDPANPPAMPPSGQMAKWVRTKRVGFNTDSYKAYFYKNLSFRVKFPKSYQHGVADGKKYPVFIFFHGIGERGSIYDNDYQLYHGGELFMNAVDNGSFDGFLLYAQSSNTSGEWSPWQFGVIKEIVENYLVPQAKADIDRVIVDGLSGGGSATWQVARTYPNFVAAVLPISAPVNVPTTNGSIPNLKYTPIWTFQGGLDDGPTPFTTESVVNAYKNAGADMNYTLFPNEGHGCWYSAWTQPTFMSYISKANKTNPWPLNGRFEYCPGETINQVIGVTPGFTSYEWRRNGVLLSGQNGNEITATDLGVYSCRILRGSTWSDWSPIPVEIKLKSATVPPPITVTGMMSRVIPSLDGSTSVPLEVPAGYATYQWQRVGNPTVLGTNRTFAATSAGDYTVKVMEQYGCSSDFSTAVKVIDANAANKPEPPTAFAATTLSKTSIRLDWIDNPAPAFNETNYEIYRAKNAAGPYQLIALTAANASTYTNNGLDANNTYYYRIRSINNSAASAGVGPVNALTQRDELAPTVPANLRVTGTTKTSVALAWNPSTDDVGVTRYEVYVNGVMSYTTTQTTFTVYNLIYNQTYNFVVKAKDLAGNISGASNQATGQPIMNGLNYKYYTFTGTWNNLPDFNTIEPVITGNMPNVALVPRTQNDNFAFLWEGYITIPVSGLYTFRTNSDDGSRLWLGALNGSSTPYTFAGAPTVNNDGLHGGQDRESVEMNLAAGVYPISMAFYEQGGGEQMIVSWRTPQSGGSFVTIPNSAFTDIPAVNGVAPAKITNLVATAISHKQIGLTWTDNSTNETGFEIWRGTNPSGDFALIGRAAANATSYTDTALTASTTYYYKIKAIGQYGESAFNVDGPGVKYEYYEIGVNSLPDFTPLIPVKTGRVPNFVLGEQNRGDQFVFKYSGKIYLPVAGAYSFFTTSDDGSNLYIDGFDDAHKVVHNDYLQGPTERGGTINLTAGYHDIYVTFFEQGGGEFLEVRYEGPSGSGIGKQIIPSSVLGDAIPNATTLDLPGGPLAPSLLVASGTTSSTVGLTWQDNSANENQFEVYRSIGTNSSYVLYTTLPANTTSFNDSALGANSIYYYKVRAVNDGSPSSYSNEDSAITVNRIPVLAGISNQSMRYGTSLAVNISAADADGGTLTLSASGLPAGFASFTQTPGTNNGVINFNNPTVTDQGTFPITITAADAFGGSHAVSFNLVVSDNYSPVVAAINNVTLNEKQTANVNLAATDQNAADVLTWSFTGLPAFATVTTGTGTAQISLAPGYADNGTYTVTAKIDDGRGAFDTKSFTITVNDVNPNYKIYVNFTTSAILAGDPWNNTAKNPAAGDLFSNLKNDAGATTSVSLQLMNTWQGSNTNGANTGNNSGVYPDNVLRSSYYTNTVTQNVKVAGLTPGGKYSFTFLGSRFNPSGSVATVYSIGAQSVTLDAANNYLNTVSINNVSPAADGTITFTVAKASGATFGYINSVVIESVYDDGTAPAKPRNLAGSFVSGNARLTWVDAAYNETAYQVYRSNTRTGTYTLLNPAGNNANATTYDDATVTGNKTFYYAVRAINSYGNSPFSDTVSVTTPNTSPLITAISDVNMNTGEIRNVNVVSTDDPGDVIALSLTGAPSWVTLSDNGNGTGVISIQPGTAAGAFSATLTATDNAGASSSRTFNINVVDASLTYTYVNFNQTYPVTGWNNFNSAPGAGVAITNLKDKDNGSTGMNITLTDGWAGASPSGTITGNNSGVYPDDIMRTTYYDATAGGRRITLSNLPTNKKYNLIFSASRASTGSLITRYTAGGKSGDLNVDNNTAGFVKLTDISPNASGQIEIVVTKVGSSSNFYIGALEIQSYPFLAVALPPTNVTATGVSVDRIKIDWTNAGSAGTGYELWRSSSYSGTYTKIADLALSATTYTNTGLTGGTVYYYKIRTAKGGGEFTEFSNIASASTVSYIVNVNLNDAAANAQSGGWNNTNTLLSTGFTLPNLINSLDQQTGINFNIVENFSGFNNALGLTTGNNSGAVPDKVMSNFYFLDFADTARFKFSSLNHATAYNVIFYAGSSYAPTNNTVYKIGNQTVALSSTNNYNNTVKINNITPDENGEILVTVYSTVGYGFLNSVSLEAVPNVTPETPTTLVARSNGDAEAATVGATATTAATTEASRIQNIEIEDATLIKAFPNPFVNDLTLQLHLKQDVAKFAVVLYDFSGKIVYRKEFNNAAKGVWRQQLDLNGKIAAKGTYILQVIGVDEKSRTTKVVKY
ncbi:MAG: fibronectin type III domain-containing protein [Chitinophagaceae bacterium]